MPLKDGWSAAHIIDSGEADPSAADDLETLKEELADCEALLV